MNFTITLVVAAGLLAGVPLLAQDSGADTNATAPMTDEAKVTYAPTAGGFGDLAASHAYEMSPVTGELDGKLDSKTARVGDRVVLKTMGKVQTSDGTVIPRGSRLVGHVTEVQAYDPVHGTARIAIAFDHAELKNGQSLAIYTLIGGVNTSASLADPQSRQDDGGGGGMMGMPVPAGALTNERNERRHSTWEWSRPGNQPDRSSLRFGRWRMENRSRQSSRKFRLCGKHGSADGWPLKQPYRRSCGCGRSRYSSYDANSRRFAGWKQLLLGGIAVSGQEHSI